MTVEQSLPASMGREAILDLCDGMLGEIGRRMHRFSWLPDPSAPIVSYLPLDSYYPGNRVVVIFAPRTSEQERLCREQVPAHGLHLLWLEPDRFDGDPASASAALHRQLELLGPLPERPRERVYRRTEPASQGSAPPPGIERTPGTIGTTTPPPHTARTRPPSAAAAAAAAARADADAAQLGVRAPTHDASFHAREWAGVMLGITLALVLGGETLLLVILFALAGGHPLLAIGLAFDVCARGLGTIAAVRAGNDDSAWACLVFGSPAAVSFAFAGDEPVRTEPAPLAGALGGLSIALCVLWILGAIVGV